MGGCQEWLFSRSSSCYLRVSEHVSSPIPAKLVAALVCARVAASPAKPPPLLPPSPQTLQYEAQYLASLPLASTYERSYMHRDTVTAVAVARGTDFFLTASADGVLKFWKKLARGVEFAKQYRAHVGPITALAVSADGSLAATASTDASVKVFDIGSFDMIAMLRLPFVPGAIEWAFQVNAQLFGGRNECVLRGASRGPGLGAHEGRQGWPGGAALRLTRRHPGTPARMAWRACRRFHVWRPRLA